MAKTFPIRDSICVCRIFRSPHADLQPSLYHPQLRPLELDKQGCRLRMDLNLLDSDLYHHPPQGGNKIPEQGAGSMVGL